MDRLEQLRIVIDDILANNPDAEEKRCGYIHLYGVSAICIILAGKRGLNSELCCVAGMLHDIWSYKVGDCPEHGQLGAVEARKILTQLNSFLPDEIELIYHAISMHADKNAVDGEMDELLKDADVFQHFIYNPSQFLEANSMDESPGSLLNSARYRRVERVLSELGIFQPNKSIKELLSIKGTPS